MLRSATSLTCASIRSRWSGFSSARCRFRGALLRRKKLGLRSHLADWAPATMGKARDRATTAYERMGPLWVSRCTDVPPGSRPGLATARAPKQLTPGVSPGLYDLPIRHQCRERATGFEPATSSLGSWHSTPELRPRVSEYGRGP